MAKQPNLAVLVSGSSTLLQAMIEEGIPIKLVAADRGPERGCLGLEIAEKAGIPAVLVKRNSFKKDEFDRVGYTEQMVSVLQEHDIDVVAMAGFMTVFAQPIFDAYPGRVLNSHPSLLPKYPGAHAVRDALADGATVTGTTIHIASAKVDDDSQVLAQEKIEIRPDDTEESLHERIKVIERKLYPEVLREFLAKLS